MWVGLHFDNTTYPLSLSHFSCHWIGIPSLLGRAPQLPEAIFCTSYALGAQTRCCQTYYTFSLFRLSLLFSQYLWSLGFSGRFLTLSYFLPVSLPLYDATQLPRGNRAHVGSYRRPLLSDRGKAREKEKENHRDKKMIKGKEADLSTMARPPSSLSRSLSCGRSQDQSKFPESALFGRSRFILNRHHRTLQRLLSFVSLNLIDIQFIEAYRLIIQRFVYSE